MSFHRPFGLAAVYLFAFTAAAAPNPAVTLKLFPVTQCPAVGEEYENLLAKLDAVKASIKAGANCEAVALKVKSLEDLMATDREKVLEIVESGRTNSLTLEQSEFVRGYAEKVTKKVTALYDLFSGSNKCFKDDNAESGLASLSGFVNEASRLVASLSGPYGTPIALAGHVVAGFLTGLDHVMKTRAGYDYSKPENWKNYVQNLCTFYGYRDHIEHLLNPQARISQLRTLQTQLDIRIDLMSGRCEECSRIRDSFTAQSATSPDVLAADQRFAKPFGTYMLYSVGIRNWVNNEIKRVERESASYWADISGRHLLSQARQDLEQFLIVREAPRFLAYQVGQSTRDWGSFNGFALQEGRVLHDQLSRINPNLISVPMPYYFANPVDVFKALVVIPIRWSLVAEAQTEDAKYSWNSYRDRGVSRLRTAEASLQVAQGFCSFFRQAGYYSSSIKAACTSTGAQNLAQQMADLDQKLASVDLGGVNIDPSIFDPGTPGRRGTRSSIESLNQLIEQLNPL